VKGLRNAVTTFLGNAAPFILVAAEEGDLGELRGAVDGQEHEEPALGQAQLAVVDHGVLVGILECGGFEIGRFLLNDMRGGSSISPGSFRSGM